MDEKRRVRWMAGRIRGATTLVDITGRRATVVQVIDGAARIRIGDLLPGGRFLARVDTKVEAICAIEPTDERGEQLSLFDDEPARPGLARCGFGPSSIESDSEAA